MLIFLSMPILMFGAVFGLRWWWHRPRRRSGDPPSHVIELHIAGLEQELDDCDAEPDGSSRRSRIEHYLADWRALRRRS